MRVMVAPGVWEDRGRANGIHAVHRYATVPARQVGQMVPTIQTPGTFMTHPGIGWGDGLGGLIRAPKARAT